jgi:TonB family protein
VKRALTGLAFLMACSRPDTTTMKLPEQSPDLRGFEAPVMVNARPPVEYPRALYEQGIEGKVILRLFVDEHGQVAAESTRVAESSGYPAFDSAAIRAVPQFHFVPALRNGTPVAALFLQPIHFRHPEAGGTTP